MVPLRSVQFYLILFIYLFIYLFTIYLLIYLLFNNLFSFGLFSFKVPEFIEVYARGFKPEDFTGSQFFVRRAFDARAFFPLPLRANRMKASSLDRHRRSTAVTAAVPSRVRTPSQKEGIRSPCGKEGIGSPSTVEKNGSKKSSVRGLCAHCHFNCARLVH